MNKQSPCEEVKDEFLLSKPVSRKRYGLIVRLSQGIVIMLAVFYIQSCHAETLTASYYSVASLKAEGTWNYSKGVMANGRQFSDMGLSCASWDYPLGTKVKVVRPDTKASVVVLVTDRTARRFKGKRIDLSIEAMRRLDGIEQGLIKVEVTKI